MGSRSRVRPAGNLYSPTRSRCVRLPLLRGFDEDVAEGGDLPRDLPARRVDQCEIALDRVLLAQGHRLEQAFAHVRGSDKGWEKAHPRLLARGCEPSAYRRRETGTGSPEAASKVFARPGAGSSHAPPGRLLWAFLGVRCSSALRTSRRFQSPGDASSGSNPSSSRRRGSRHQTLRSTCTSGYRRANCARTSGSTTKLKSFGAVSRSTPEGSSARSGSLCTAWSSAERCLAVRS